MSIKKIYHVNELGSESELIIAEVKDASEEYVELVLNKDADHQDGRSDWKWIRLSNGDLILGVYPYGDTYFECEIDSSW